MESIDDPIQTMTLFFEKSLDQLDEEFGTDSERQALAFIVRSIKDEKVYTTTQEVEEMMVNKELCDEICNKMSSRIPQSI